MPRSEPSVGRARLAAVLLYGQGVLWVALLALVGLMRAYGFLEDEFNYGLCVFFALFVVWSLASWKALTGYYCDAYTLFFASLVLFSGGEALLEIFGQNPRGLLGGKFPAAQVQVALLLVVISLMAFHTGALLRLRTYRGHRTPEIEGQSEAAAAEVARPLRELGIVIIVLTVGPACYELYQAVSLVQVYGYFGLSQQAKAVAGLDAWTQVLASFLVPGGLLLLAGSKGRYGSVLLAWAIVGIPALTYVVLGWRNIGLQALAALLWLHSTAIKPIKKSIIAALIVGVLCGIAAIASVRNDPMSSLEDRLDNMATSYQKMENPLVEAIAEMGGSLVTIVHTVELVPRARPHDWGTGYLQALATVFPNLFWDVHPSFQGGLPSHWLANEVDPYAAKMGLAIGFSMIAEAYMNFSWVGPPLVMLAVGFSVAWFVLWVLQRPDPLRLATEAILISFVLFVARAESHVVVRSIVWECVIPYCLIRYMIYRRSQPSQPAQPAGLPLYEPSKSF